jgi:HK97 family phage major capsid protein
MENVKLAQEQLNQITDTVKGEVKRIESDLKKEFDTKFDALKAGQVQVDEIKKDMTEAITKLQKEVAEAKQEAKNVNLATGNDKYVAKVDNPFSLYKQPNKVDSMGLKIVHDFLTHLHVMGNYVRTRKGMEFGENELEIIKKAYNAKRGVSIDEIGKKFSSTGLGFSAKALSVSGASGGQPALFPPGFGANLIEDMELDRVVELLFEEITQPLNPFYFPAMVGTEEAQFLAELAEPDAQTYTDADRTWTAKRFAQPLEISKEAELGAVVAIVDIMVRRIRDAISRAAEQVLINGDASATHQDSDTHAGSSTLAAKAFNGLRKLTNSGAKTDLSTLNATNMIALRKKMGVYGQNLSRLAYIVSMTTYINLLLMEKVLTVDKYGQMATLATGELGKLAGIPIIVSEYIREDLNATGVYDGVTTNKSIVLLVNRSAFWRSKYGDIAINTDQYVTKNSRYWQIERRMGFNKIYPTADNCIAMGYNVGTA